MNFFAEMEKTNNFWGKKKKNSLFDVKWGGGCFSLNSTPLKIQQEQQTHGCSEFSLYSSQKKKIVKKYMMVPSKYLP